MSYIIEYISPLISTKLTSKGREKIARGNLTYSYWSLGDSEFDYNNYEILKNNGDVLQPKAIQPLSKSYLRKRNCDFLYELGEENKRVEKCVVRNTLDSIGHFNTSGSVFDDYTIHTVNDYIKLSGFTNLASINGTNQIDLGTTTGYESGDYILIKIGNVIQGEVQMEDSTEPILHLWYQLENNSPSTIATLDRNLPDFSSYNDIVISWIIYPGGESIEDFYSEANPDRFWNNNVLEFTDNCEIPSSVSKVWNMNNVWSESVAGTQAKHQTYECYGSASFLGSKEYYGYNIDCDESVSETADCEDKLLSQMDDFVKGISIIHYSNLNKLNKYGEYFYVDSDERVHLDLPNIMYHRRYFTDGEQLKLGMRFISSTEIKYVKNSEIPYYELLEYPDYINPNSTPRTVGRVFYTLKTVVIHDEEILASLSYKASRNFTLPSIEGKMIRPINGIGSGVLKSGKTMYVTYALEANDGLKYSLPHQKYTKFINNSKIDRDIEFSLEDIGLLRYMNKKEFNWNGYGFYAHKFKLLVQIVDGANDRPKPNMWTAIDYTSNLITSNNNETINPSLFEVQDSDNTGFKITTGKLNLGYNYDLTILNFAEGGCNNDLQLGDERFLFGNFKATIASDIYKSIFTIIIDGQDIVESSNKSWEVGDPLFLTEVPIYDELQELVMITKLSKPIEIDINSKIAIEIQMDF